MNRNEHVPKTRRGPSGSEGRDLVVYFLREFMEAVLMIMVSRYIASKPPIFTETMRFAFFIAVFMVVLDIYDSGLKGHIRTGLFCNIGSSMNAAILH